MAKTEEEADAETLMIWKAGLVLMDGRTFWARVLKRAIKMVEERDREIEKLKGNHNV